METGPTWEQYTAMQFELERKLTTAKADKDKWKFACQKKQEWQFIAENREKEIIRLEKLVKKLEERLNAVK